MPSEQKSYENKPTMILFNKVSKVYGNGVGAIQNLSMRIYRGEFVFVMGASGAGKSTLIKLIMKEEEPTHGKIFVNGRDLAKIRKGSVQRFRRQIGVVFQDFRLLEQKTVYGNVAFAMEIMGRSQHDIQTAVDDALTLMGLTSKANDYPRELSGGEQQRVALARAIVNTPKILIADEPTGNLDPRNAQQIMDLLGLINDRGTTVIVATHAQDMARQSGRRILYLDHGARDDDLSSGGEPERKRIITAGAYEESGDNGENEVPESLFTEDRLAVQDEDGEGGADNE